MALAPTTLSFHSSKSSFSRPSTITIFPTSTTLVPQCHNLCSRIAGYQQCTSTAPFVCLCSVLLLDGPNCSDCLKTLSPEAATELGSSLAICSALPPCPSPCTGPFTTVTSTSSFVVYPTETTPPPPTRAPVASSVQTSTSRTSLALATFVSRGQKVLATGDGNLSLLGMLLSVTGLIYIWI